MNLLELLKNSQQIEFVLSDGCDHLPLARHSANPESLRSYLSQVIQYYRENDVDTISLVDIIVKESVTTITVKSESIMIYTLFWIAIGNRANKQITKVSTGFGLDYDVLHVISCYIAKEEWLVKLMNNIDFATN